ncbi:MAG: hypothetical protein ACE15E_15875 [Acidobacteriota bacterium]
MSYQTVTYDREKLYQEVWTEPMFQLAKKYGLSDVGLAKICRKLEIPRPDRGYWAKLQAGKRVEERPELPPLPGVETLTVERQVKDEDPLDEETEKQVHVLLAAEKEPINQIRVNKRLSSPHPLIERAEGILGGKQTYRWDDERRYKHLAIDVSDACLPRALRIMDALLKALEKRQFSVNIVKEEGRDRRYETRVGILEEAIPIRLREMYKQVEVTDSTYKRIDLVRNRRLELQVSGWGYPTRCRRDGQKPLEEQLNSFVIGLIQEAAERRGRSLRWERERKEAEERRRLAEEAEKRRQAEAKRIEQLEQDADDWDRSQRLRAYIGAVEKQHGGERCGDEMRGWLEWARRHAENLDPLNRFEPGNTNDDPTDDTD